MNGEAERTALRFLSRSPLLHADMISALTLGTAEAVSAGETGVLLRFGSGYMMSAADPATADAMLAGIPKTQLLDAHQKFYVEAARRKFGLGDGIECRQAAYLKKEPLPAAVSPAVIRPLDETALPFVLQNYTHADINGADYLRGLLRAGNFFGAYVRGKPAGFIGMHEEGSIGLLEVLPEYRRRGIAAALAVFQANRILAQGRVPFSQIEPGNAASFALHRRLGFEISQESVFWLF